MNKRALYPTIACVALLAGTPLASAQVACGVKAGVNFAKMAWGGGSNSASVGDRTAWMAGGFLDIAVSKHLFVQSEVLFTMKGADFAATGGTPVATMKLAYFDVPILLRVDAPTNHGVVPFVYAGPDIGVLHSAKISRPIVVKRMRWTVTARQRSYVRTPARSSSGTGATRRAGRIWACHLLTV